jgi:hypothetical protein
MYGAPSKLNTARSPPEASRRFQIPAIVRSSTGIAS